MSLYRIIRMVVAAGSLLCIVAFVDGPRVDRNRTGDKSDDYQNHQKLEQRKAGFCFVNIGPTSW